MAVYPPTTGGGGGSGGPGPPGPAGKSAYEVAKDAGFTGTEAEWLESLQGADGKPGADSTVPGPDGPEGPEGASAYEVAKKNGFSGTEAEWLASLKGDQGEPGKDAAVGGARFLAEVTVKDNGIAYPKSLDMRTSSGFAAGPHHDVTSAILRVAHEDPFYDVIKGLYNKVNGESLIWSDDRGRKVHYLIRSASSHAYGDYDKYTFTVVYDPPPEGDWGTTTHWTWANYQEPFTVEVPMASDVIYREDLEAHDEHVADLGITFTGDPAPIIWGGHASRGNPIFKWNSTWNNQYPVYFRWHPSNYGELQWNFEFSNSSYMTWNFGTSDVLKVDRYGIKVNGSSVSRSVDLLDSVRGAKTFDDFKQALIARLEAREAEGVEAEDE